MMSSTAPATAPNQCGVHVENSTASPGSIVARIAIDELPIAGLRGPDDALAAVPSPMAQYTAMPVRLGV